MVGLVAITLSVVSPALELASNNAAPSPAFVAHGVSAIILHAEVGNYFPRSRN